MNRYNKVDDACSLHFKDERYKVLNFREILQAGAVSFERRSIK